MTYRKTFACGHRGLGQYCHCCDALQKRQSAVVDVRAEKSARMMSSATFVSADGQFTVALDRIPHPKLVQKAQHILTRIIDHGDAYTAFGGKRMHASRSIISVPIGYRFRLVLQERENGEKVPIDIMSHETYNQYIRRLPPSANLSPS